MSSSFIPETVRLRRARALLINLEGRSLTGCNFLEQRRTFLNELQLTVLATTADWTTPVKLFQGLSCCFSSGDIARVTLALMEARLLLVAGTPEAGRDARYERDWAWGDTAGMYHFGIKDPNYMTPAATSAWLMDRVRTTPQIPLYSSNDDYGEVIDLEAVPLDGSVLKLMRARRSYRGFDGGADSLLSLDTLGACLFAGLGIVGFVPSLIPNTEALPLTMTPSGGARNPYEAYVYALKVASLKRGVYHYSAIDHTLGLVQDDYLPSAGEVLAGQPWFDDVGALVLLVANFDRTMWKYPHPTGFRVVLLEAGHIAQNILLMATERGLAAAPTCAISDRTAERLLDLPSITAGAVYSVGLGVRGDVPTAADVPHVLPNHRLPAVNGGR